MPNRSVVGSLATIPTSELPKTALSSPVPDPTTSARRLRFQKSRLTARTLSVFKSTAEVSLELKPFAGLDGSCSLCGAVKPPEAVWQVSTMADTWVRCNKCMVARYCCTEHQHVFPCL